MPGPIARTYKAGSIIYFEGDKSNDEVYVLQKGRVILTATSLDLKDETKENVRKGEFFGVKSAIGHYPREETAQVVADSLILVFTTKSFEELALKNPRIVLQMLKVFSAHLRKVHKKVREVLGEAGTEETSFELLRVAEYYYKSGNQDHALYAYEAYLKYYGNTPLANRARKMVELLQKGKPYPLDAPTLEEEAEASRDSVAAPPGELIQNTSSIPDIPDLDDFGDTPADEPTSTEQSLSQIFYDGMTAFSQQDYDKAIASFTTVTEAKHFSGPEETKYYEQAFYELGRCYYKKNDLTKATEFLMNFIKRFPRNDLQKKAMLILGEIFEKKNNPGQAKQIYSKVIQIPPKDKDTTKAAERLKRLSQ